MSDTVVKCQNNRLRIITDGNGSTTSKKNALCLRLMGKMADIDDRVLRMNITKALQSNDPVSAIVKVFCDTFYASYYCAACKVFMKVRYASPGYEVETEPRDLSGFDKIMRPKIRSRQMEVA